MLSNYNLLVGYLLGSPRFVAHDKASFKRYNPGSCSETLRPAIMTDISLEHSVSHINMHNKGSRLKTSHGSRQLDTFAIITNRLFVAIMAFMISIYGLFLVSCDVMIGHLFFYAGVATAASIIALVVKHPVARMLCLSPRPAGVNECGVTILIIAGLLVSAAWLIGGLF